MEKSYRAVILSVTLTSRATAPARTVDDERDEAADEDEEVQHAAHDLHDVRVEDQPPRLAVRHELGADICKHLCTP